MVPPSKINRLSHICSEKVIPHSSGLQSIALHLAKRWRGQYLWCNLCGLAVDWGPKSFRRRAFPKQLDARRRTCFETTLTTIRDKPGDDTLNPQRVDFGMIFPLSFCDKLPHHLIPGRHMLLRAIIDAMDQLIFPARNLERAES